MNKAEIEQKLSELKSQLEAQADLYLWFSLQTPTAYLLEQKTNLEKEHMQLKMQHETLLRLLAKAQ